MWITFSLFFFSRMKFKSFLARPYASVVHNRVRKAAASAIPDQNAWLLSLMKVGGKTAFGKDHSLSQISDYSGFKEAVPIRDYEAMTPYIDQIKGGKADVLWKGKPIYFAKT